MTRAERETYGAKSGKAPAIRLWRDPSTAVFEPRFGQIESRGVVMEAPAWLKPAISGGLVGAVATMVVGFSYGGWMLGSSAETLAERRSATAVTEALVPVCIGQSKTDPEAAGKLAALKALTSSYDQREFVMKSGWATIPASDAPNGDLAEACAKLLIKPLQT
jgi:hypothetical protein